MELPFSHDLAGHAVPLYAPGGWGFVTERERAAFPALQTPELNNAFAPAWWYGDDVLSELSADGHGVSVHPSAAVRAADLDGRALPLWFKADTGPGQFRVCVTITALQDCGEVLLFLSRRRLCWRGALAKGQSVRIRALCDVSPIIPSGGGNAAEGEFARADDTSVDITLLGAALTAVRIEPWQGPMLYLMGDSTVTDQPAQYPYAPGATYAGWGQVLPLYLGEAYCVSNHSHSGLSTETFRTKGHYALLKSLLHAGDTVLIQFAHNDQKRLHLAPQTGYRENLLRYIAELRAAGASPVLVTPLARNTWSSPTEYNDMLAPFAEAMRTVGREQGVPVLELHAAMKEHLLRRGMDAARPWFRPCDYTHTDDFGAHLAAGFVAGELARLGLAAPAQRTPWAPHPPLAMLAPPPAQELHGRTPPENEKPLIDYGLIPGAPWPIT